MMVCNRSRQIASEIHGFVFASRHLTNTPLVQVRFDTPASDVINSVSVSNMTTNHISDSPAFDHVAISAVDEMSGHDYPAAPIST